MNHPQDHSGNRSCYVKWRMISSQQIKHPRILSFSPRTFIHSLEDSLGRGWASHPYHEKSSNAAAVFSHQTLADFIPNLAGTTGATGCSTRWFCCLRIIATLKKKRQICWHNKATSGRRRWCCNGRNRARWTSLQPSQSMQVPVFYFRWRDSFFRAAKRTVWRWLHPWRLTWNIIMEVCKIIFLSKLVIWRFHVNLPGCMMMVDDWWTMDDGWWMLDDGQLN